MTTRELIAEIAEVIGPADKQGTDRLVDPEGHATLYAAAAPGLVEILRRPEIKAVAELHADASDRSARLQSRFKNYSNYAAWAIVAAAACSAAMVTVGIFVPEVSGAGEAATEAAAKAAAAAADEADSRRSLLGAVLGLLGLLAGAAASVLLSIIKGSTLLEKWMSERAEAESGRLEYFSKITAAEPDAEVQDTSRTRLEQLEYFRRYQLEGQAIYYRNRGLRHETDARRAVVLSAVWIGVAGCLTASAGILAGLSAKLLAVGAFAVVAQAMASRLTSVEAISQDSRNAERYRRTGRALTAILGRVGEVREAVAQGDPDTTTEFVEVVHSQLSLEHRQWLEVQQGAESAVARLEQHLKAAKEKQAAGVSAPSTSAAAGT